MNLNQIKEWKSNHRYITTETEHADSSGNIYAEEIYQNKETGKFYALDYLNGRPYETSRDVYSEPRQVFKHTRMMDFYESEEDLVN